MELKNRAIIVTGAGSGIGRALALAFAGQGARVVCAARRLERIQQTVCAIEQQGGQAMAIETDVTCEASVQQMVDQCLAAYGAVDVLFNNAGSFQALGAVWEVDPELWWQDVTVNLRGTMLCCRAVLPSMIQRNEGIVINMTGGNQIPGGTGYSCSKMGVIRFTELLARELKEKKFAVLAFTMGPGFVRTEMTEMQIQGSQGQFWLPSSKLAVEQGRDRPAEDCARATLELIRVACPALSGHAFDPDSDFTSMPDTHAT